MWKDIGKGLLNLSHTRLQTGHRRVEWTCVGQSLLFHYRIIISLLT